MTIAPQSPAGVAPADVVTVTVDGIEVRVPKGMLVIRVAELMGIEIPRFCDHPLLDPVAACRMCLIEIEGQAKPQPACAIAVTDGMVVRTQRTSEMADTAQEGVMEFLLLNHPLDCPVCDKGGECPLQNQAMTAGRGTSRFEEEKRTFEKPINMSAQILLDRERCVSGRHRARPALRLLLLGQHHPDLPRGCAHEFPLPLPGAALRPGEHADHVRALRIRLLAAHRCAPRSCDASPRVG